MKSKSDWYRQLKALRPTLLVICLPTLCALGVLVIVSRQTHIPISDFTRDALSVAEAPFYFGLFSQIGMLFWCSSAAICFFSSAVLREKAEYRERSTFLLFSGLVTLILLLDDLFLLHDVIFPEYFRISEKFILVGYGIVISLYLMRFRRTILRTEFLLFLLALGFFGLSIFVDKVPMSLPEHHLFEDGSKLFGIVSWFGYFTRTSMQSLRGASP